MDISLNISTAPIKKPEKVTPKPKEVTRTKPASKPIIIKDDNHGFVFNKKKEKFKKHNTSQLAFGDTKLQKKTFQKNEGSDKVKTFPLFKNKAKQKELVLRDDEPIKESEKQDVFGTKETSLRDLNVHDFMLQYLEKKGITKATAIQQKAIPKILNGDNLMIRSETGSGKTLAYAIPIVHSLSTIRPKISRKDGVQVIVLVPTRELALQTLEVFKELVYSYCWIVPGQVSGGENRKAEKIRLRKGLNILIGTPGRLMDHFLHTANMKLDQIRCLVIDEADSLVNMGHKEDVKKLVNMIEEARNKVYDPISLLKSQGKPSNPTKESKKDFDTDGMPLQNPQSKKMQTIFLSATLTEKVEELKDLILKDHESVEADAPALQSTETGNITAPNIHQKYIVTNVKTRLVVLASFIVKRCKEDSCKMFIFMDTRQMVDFHEELFRKCLMNSGRSQLDKDENEFDSDAESDEEDFSDIKLFKIHGDMEQKDRVKTYKSFRTATKGILICTDAAARGIDVPNADCVIQYTVPLNTDIYIHRIGRTARAGRAGESVIFVTEPEMEYISFIKKTHNIRIEREMEDDILEHLIPYMPHIQAHNMRVAAEALQKRFEQAVENDKKLFLMACQAYLSWYRYYRMFPNIQRKFFDAKKIHQGHYIGSFGLCVSLSEIHKAVKMGSSEEDNKADKKLNPKLSNNPDEQTDSVPSKMPSKKRSRTKNLVVSEYDSGIPRKKKKHFN